MRNPVSETFLVLYSKPDERTISFSLLTVFFELGNESKNKQYKGSMETLTRKVD